MEQGKITHNSPLKWEQMIYDAGYSFNEFCLMSGFSHSRLSGYCDGTSKIKQPSAERFKRNIILAQQKNRRPFRGRKRTKHGY